MNWIADFRGKKWFLSNMYPCQFKLDGIVFNSVEHYFFYNRAKHNKDRIRILKSDTANQAKFIGRSVEEVDNWNAIKLEVMLTALRAKFGQNEDLKKLLLETGDDLIEEGNSWNDLYWGVDYYTRKGENHLGKLIMRVRSELKSEKKNKLNYI